MSHDIDAILRQVAAGELTPDEAIPLIDAARAAATPEWGTPPSNPPGSPGAPENPPVGDESGAGGRSKRSLTVRIAASFRSVDVIADPSIDQVTATGSHRVRREGDVLVVESLQLPGFVDFEGGPRDSCGAWSFAGLPRSAAWARSMKGNHLIVRVNPLLPIEIDSAAAALRVSGCQGGTRVRILAASLKVDHLRGPFELDAVTSSIKGTAAITGVSRISCESSSVKLSLLPGSDIRVTSGTNRFGKVVLPGEPMVGPSGQQESVIGAGKGTLTIDGVMSSITISSGHAHFKATA
jgi:hypothetical protein